MTTLQQHQQWMQRCLALAEKAAANGEVPVGAIVVGSQRQEGGLEQQDVVIGEGWNQPIVQHDPSAHAEIIALRQAAIKLQNYRLPNTRLYVTIEPCAMCAGAIIHARIGQVIFGAREPKAGAVCSQLQLLSNADGNKGYSNYAVDYVEGVLADEAAALMQNFFRSRR